MTVLAGVGVLLLAMGVGVLIGRSGSSSSNAGPTAVITVPAAGATGSSTPGGSGGEFSDDWPSGKSGYAVLLQSLPQSSTSTSAVAQAKSAAGAKGAPAVGALKTGDFSSLTAGSYDIYSGEYTTKAQAQKALTSLKRSFPGASVIRVSQGARSSASASGESGSAGSGSSGESGSSGSGSTQQLQKLSKTKGKNYEQESKNHRKKYEQYGKTARRRIWFAVLLNECSHLLRSPRIFIYWSFGLSSNPATHWTPIQYGLNAINGVRWGVTL